MQNVDLNTAQEQELSRIPGIDQMKARQIIEYRNRNGSFKSINDLKKIAGLPQGVIETLQRAGVTIGKQPAA
jgi:competence protein ComEA